MSDVKKYIARRKKTNPQFAEGFEEGSRDFEIGILLRQTREEAGLTQEQLADLINGYNPSTPPEERLIDELAFRHLPPFISTN